MRFCRNAIATACARSEAPSFSYRRFRWVFTVSSEIDRKLAISLLLLPSALSRGAAALAAVIVLMLGARAKAGKPTRTALAGSSQFDSGLRLRETRHLSGSQSPVAGRLSRVHPPVGGEHLPCEEARLLRHDVGAAGGDVFGCADAADRGRSE